MANDHFKFDSWEEGLVSLSGGVNGLGAVEHAAVLDDGSDLGLRMVLIAGDGDGERVTSRVFANYRDMHDEGEFHRVLRFSWICWNMLIRRVGIYPQF